MELIEKLLDRPLVVNAIFSVVAFLLSLNVLPRFYPLFIKAGLCGKDMSKRVLPGKEPVKV